MKKEVRTAVYDSGIESYKFEGLARPFPNYLESVRIGEARNLLEQGAPPIEVAARTGFFDQSHFTKCFTSFIGLTPGEYRNMFKKKKRSGIFFENFIGFFLLFF